MSLKDNFVLFGVPELIRCDEGSSFTSAEFKPFITHQGAVLKNSPLYCPRSDGLVERFNQIIRKLSQTTFEDSRSWYDTLKPVLQTHRSIIYTALGKSPYEIRNPLRLLEKKNEVYSSFSKASIQEFK